MMFQFINSEMFFHAVWVYAYWNIKIITAYWGKSMINAGIRHLIINTQVFIYEMLQTT